jgi:hypothetical protein
MKPTRSPRSPATRPGRRCLRQENSARRQSERELGRGNSSPASTLIPGVLLDLVVRASRMAQQRPVKTALWPAASFGRALMRHQRVSTADHQRVSSADDADGADAIVGELEKRGLRMRWDRYIMVP